MANKKAFIFPGQGAQYPGMGKEIYVRFEEARQTYKKANEVLGFDISEICFNGRQDELDKTSMCQPAILVTSIAILNILKNRGVNGAAECCVTAGLSLGEYTAHVIAGSISFEDAVRLVYMRGKFMQEACEQNPGGMMAILGLSDKDVIEICEQGRPFGEVCVANYNSPGQVVISGEINALKYVSNLAKEKGAKTIQLKVDGAFHSNLMSSAKERLKREIGKTTISRARIPVIANINARYVTEPAEIRASLIRQLNSPVLWCQSMQAIINNGINKFYEFGPGKVLAGLLRKIDPTIEVKNIESIESIEENLIKQ